jgi:hypothetical protein
MENSPLTFSLHLPYLLFEFIFLLTHIGPKTEKMVALAIIDTELQPRPCATFFMNHESTIM